MPEELKKSGQRLCISFLNWINHHHQEEETILLGIEIKNKGLDHKIRAFLIGDESFVLNTIAAGAVTRL